MTEAPTPTLRAKRFPAPSVGQWIAGVFGAIVLLIVIFILLFQWDWLRGPLARFASAQTGRSVRIDGHLRVHLLTWTPTVRVEGVKVGQPDWGPKGDMFQVDSVTVSVKLMPLFVGRVELPLVDIESPNLDVIQQANGRANWDFSKPGAPKKPSKPLKLPPIERFVVAHGKLRADIAPRHLQFAGSVSTTEVDTGANAMSFHMLGQGELNRHPFHMDVGGGPLINIHHDRPYPFTADIRGGETHFTARGQVTRPFDFGQVGADVTLTGRDLNQVYDLTGIVLPNTPPYSLSGHMTRDQKVYSVANMAGRVGGSDLEGKFRVDTGAPRLYVNAALRSRNLDFKDLAFLFGAKPAPASATKAAATKAAAVSKVAVKPAASTSATRLLPDATLQTDRIRKMDADLTYRADSVKPTPNLPLKGVAFDVGLKAGVLNIDPVTFSFPQGALTGKVRLDARGAQPITDLDLRLSNVRMENFLAAGANGAPKPLEGTLAARAKLHGVGDSVHKAASTADGQVTALIPHGQIRQAFAELLGIDASKGLIQLLGKDQTQTDIRCAVADFAVKDGVLTAQDVIIDTGVVRVNGAGTINLADESLNLAFQGKPKAFRLFRLNAPITVGGHLAAPAFGVKPGGAIAQAGVAGVLAAAVNPLLLILPFVDPGSAKNADCTGLAQAAQTGAAPVTPAMARPHAPVDRHHRLSKPVH